MSSRLAFLTISASIGYVVDLRMPVGAWLELDLLRQRRERLGLVAPAQINKRKLLLRGFAIGGSVLLLVLLTCTVLLWLTQLLRDREQSLQSGASTYDRYLKELASTRDLDKKLSESNQALAVAIAGLRSGSALLAEVSNLVPKQVQLTKLNVKGDVMEISALAPQPFGLARSNQFQLLLEASSFFDVGDVSLVRAVETQSPTQSPSTSGLLASPNASQLDSSFLSFDLSAGFSSDEKRFTRSRLLELGAVGLARRLKILQSEGLLK